MIYFFFSWSLLSVFSFFLLTLLFFIFSRLYLPFFRTLLPLFPYFLPLPIYSLYIHVFVFLSSSHPSTIFFLFSFTPLFVYLLWFYVFIFLPSLFPLLVCTVTLLFIIVSCLRLPVQFSLFRHFILLFYLYTPFLLFSCIHLPLELSFLLSSFTPLTLLPLLYIVMSSSSFLLFHLSKSFDY